MDKRVKGRLSDQAVSTQVCYTPSSHTAFPFTGITPFTSIYTGITTELGTHTDTNIQKIPASRAPAGGTRDAFPLTIIPRFRGNQGKATHPIDPKYQGGPPVATARVQGMAMRSRQQQTHAKVPIPGDTARWRRRNDWIATSRLKAQAIESKRTYTSTLHQQ